MKTGLLIGKFAPLHKGHQYVIETALREVDELIIMIYDSPLITDIPLNVRADWFRRIYHLAPFDYVENISIIEAWDGPPQMGRISEIKKLQEEYILRRLNGRKIDVFYSNEFYGEHMSKALQAEDRQIDPNRQKWSISATKIRNNPYFQRKYLDPIVYRDYVTNVVFLGAPSTGKTTLTEALAKRHKTVWMPEYGREYWEKHAVNRRLTKDQLTQIAEGHLSREEKMLYSAKKYLFTDTNALTTRIFSLYYHNEVWIELEDIAGLCHQRYDIVFVCDTDIPYEETWDRSGDVNRLLMQRMIIADLIARKIPFHVVRGTLEERIRQVEEDLILYKKFKRVNTYLPLGTYD
jgi:HTH-type transcriptional repressor of NAD biosynthesis genes